MCMCVCVCLDNIVDEYFWVSHHSSDGTEAVEVRYTVFSHKENNDRVTITAK